MNVGNIEGYDVIYDEVTDTLTCKNLIVPAVKLIEAFESAIDRCNVQGNLVLRKFDSGVTLGCFELTKQNSKQLIKTIKDARSKNSRSAKKN